MSYIFSSYMKCVFVYTITSAFRVYMFETINFLNRNPLLIYFFTIVSQWYTCGYLFKRGTNSFVIFSFLFKIPIKSDTYIFFVLYKFLQISKDVMFRINSNSGICVIINLI